jgi:NAD(P)-dependent dehydrogenase (short-subunit alcohol dehydrogenase family)
VELTGRLVLLTGARRIGASIAQAVAEKGADVALVYRTSSAEAETVATQVRSRGSRS